ncbi:MAG: hypothetical protein IJS01_02160 [Lentisphaeria bacterium]|nr:hypothetical protein [Lentisphaeria bacterium]
MMTKRYALLSAVCASLCLAADIPTAKTDIVLDGKLDDPAWKEAEVHADFRPFANSGKKSLKAKTQFQVLFRGGALYVGVRCEEPLMSKLKAPESGAIWGMDGVEVFMAPTGNPDEFYQFLVTASNIRWSQWYGEGGVIHPDPYEPLWESQVCKGKDFWSVEMKFPLSGFYMTRNRNWNTTWLFNVTRTRRPVIESATWSPMRYKSQESKLFRSLSGFPVRKPEEDIFIQNASVEAVTAMGKGFRASTLLEIQATEKSAGKGQIVVTVPGGKPVRLKTALEPGLNRIAVPNTSYPRTGKIPVRIEWKSGLADLGRVYPVAISYNPVAIVAETPCYANTFFPDQDCSKVAGHLKINSDKPVRAEVTIAGDGVPEEKKVFDGVRGKVPFSFATPGMKHGRTTVTAEIFDNGTKTASSSIVIRRPDAGGKVYYRVENGCVLKNGKPFFPRDVYAKYFKGGEAFKKKFDADDLFLNRFSICILEPFRLLGRGIEPETTKDRRPSQKLFDAVKRRIERFRDREFVFYYLSDEPECREISPIYLKYLYDYVKELDPLHPVLICSRSCGAYVDCADVFSTHPYPGPFFDSDKRTKRLMNNPIFKTRDYVRDISKLKRADKATGLTPQFFSYGNGTNRLSDYLTFDELECTIWSAIVNGGRLLWAYAYHDLGDRPTLYEGLRYFYQSIGLLEDIICLGRSTPLESSDKMLEGALFTLGKEYLLVICNVSENAVEGELKSPEEFPALTEFRGPGKLPAGNGVRRTFKPYEVLLYSTRAASGVKSRAEVTAMIGKMERLRSARGNVLHGRGYEIEIDSSNPAGRNNLWQQGKMFDGTVDIWAWNHPKGDKPGWFEISFPKFVPTFGSIRLHGYNIDGATVKIWKFGEWKNIDVKPVKSGEYGWEWKLAKPQRTVKVRFDFPGSDKEKNIELYEIELVK